MMERPILIHSGQQVAIYRLGECKGYKVIVDPDPTEEQVLCLLAEEEVSRFLPPRCAQRNVIQVKSFQGNPSIEFQWANGVTLEEWLKGGSRGLKEKLRIAIAITKTLSYFHEGCVVHNCLSFDHIILDVCDELCCASLISLSRAVIISELPLDDAETGIRTDLRSLGVSDPCSTTGTEAGDVMASLGSVV